MEGWGEPLVREGEREGRGGGGRRRRRRRSRRGGGKGEREGEVVGRSGLAMVNTHWLWKGKRGSGRNKL